VFSARPRGAPSFTVLSVMVSGESGLVIDDEFLMRGCVDTYGHNVQPRYGLPFPMATEDSLIWYP